MTGRGLLYYPTSSSVGIRSVFQRCCGRFYGLRMSGRAGRAGARKVLGSSRRSLLSTTLPGEYIMDAYNSLTVASAIHYHHSP